MELYLKVAAAAILSAILTAVLSKNSRASALLISLAACVVFLASVAALFGSVRSRLAAIIEAAGFGGETVGSLVKICFIALLTQLCEAFCRESGSQSIGKAAEICGGFAALYVSLPLIESVWSVLKTLIGG